MQLFLYYKSLLNHFQVAFYDAKVIVDKSKHEECNEPFCWWIACCGMALFMGDFNPANLMLKQAKLFSPAGDSVFE